MDGIQRIHENGHISLNRYTTGNGGQMNVDVASVYIIILNLIVTEYRLKYYVKKKNDLVRSSVNSTNLNCFTNIKCNYNQLQ